jgi:hypothetical protein
MPSGADSGGRQDAGITGNDLLLSNLDLFTRISQMVPGMPSGCRELLLVSQEYPDIFQGPLAVGRLVQD